MLGSLVDIQTAFSLVDICMGLLTITNLVAIAVLVPKVVYLLEYYKRQLRNGVEPEFHRSQMQDEELECWK